jgi:hypothetical protein
MRIAIVGAGAAGSMLAHHAQAAGHHVTVIASTDTPHSTAATAVLRRAYHLGKPDELAAFDYALDYYHTWGIKLVQGALYSTYRSGASERADADWYLIDPADPLVMPDVLEDVLDVTGTCVWLGRGQYIEADVVVLATGATGSLAATGKRTWGVTCQHSDPDALKLPHTLRAYQFAPYKTILAGVVNGNARLGSSSAGNLNTAMTQIHKMLKIAYERDWLTTMDGWEAIPGARLSTPNHWWRQSDGVWRLTGFHRTGYALAPAAARELLTAIERHAE